jgi:xylulokinase
VSLLGLDIGTTGCKAVVFNPEGKILVSAYREYPLIFPKPGWIELNSDLVWRRTKEVIQEVAVRTRRDPIRALSVSAQGEAVTPIGKTGEALYNSIVTFDSRADCYVDWWNKRVGKKRVFRITGMPVSGITTLNKILWIKHQRPKLFSSAWKFLCYEDLAFFRLGLTPTIDYSLAARTMAFDVSEKRWSSRILAVAGVDHALLPNVAPSGTIVGEIPSKIARELNLTNKVIAVAGGHDQPCGALGSGVITPRTAMYATGTVECIAPAFPTLVLSDVMMKNNLCCYPHARNGMYVSIAFNFTGGSLLRWYRDVFGQEEFREARERKRDVYDILTARVPKMPTSLMILPHFTMTGTPLFDAKSKGVLLGLTLSTTKEEIIKAILEGVTYEIKLNVELYKKAGIVVDEFRAIGGGAKSDVWMQLKADILGTPVVKLKVSEAACLGAALLAGVAAGEYRSVDEAVRETVKKERRFYPNHTRNAQYEEKFALYTRIYPSLKDLLHAM